jgi:hypothetical protein
MSSDSSAQASSTSPAAAPTLEQFLAAPVEQVRRVAPATMLWVVEGTRRSAALAGIEPHGEEYPRWSLQRMCDCLQLFFHHGVRHVVTPLLSPSHFAELTPHYRERLIDWVALLVDDSEVLRRFQEQGWRVRLLGGGSLPALRPIAERLVAATPRGEHTVWCSVVAHPGAAWDELLGAVAAAGARTREEAIRALYGEELPLATLLLAFGKPVLSTEQLPPLLLGKVDCYWTQRPGYRVSERELRTVLHDAAFVRSTWQEDKTGRAQDPLWAWGSVWGPSGIRLQGKATVHPVTPSPSALVKAAPSPGILLRCPGTARQHLAAWFFLGGL